MPLARKSVLAFACEADAVHASGRISETPGFEAFPLALCEAEGMWFLECYDDGALADRGGAGIRHIAGIEVTGLSVESVPQIDWVSETQRLLSPVRAGRFIVHGSHDRGRIRSQWAIEIEAGRAFGTAHHGTTRGCLIALDRLTRLSDPGSILDLGTGSGVLAIAAAKAFARKPLIAALDMDPVAVAVASENCRKNGVSENVRACLGDGVKLGCARSFAPFGLVMANILAKPLFRLAPALHRLTGNGGLLILSGLLSSQRREIAARYRAQGFRHL